jgi:hypothetical protein
MPHTSSLTTHYCILIRPCLSPLYAPYVSHSSIPLRRRFGFGRTEDAAAWHAARRSRLDLGHGGPTSSDAATAQVDAPAAGADYREEGRYGEAGEAEPEERRDCLSLFAALFPVVGAVGDAVVEGVPLCGC